MARKRGGTGERGGCLWKLADIVLLGVIVWAIAWFGPWRGTVRPAVGSFMQRLPALLRRAVQPRPSPSPAAPASPQPPPPAEPTPAPPVPSPETSPTPGPATPSPAASPTPAPAESPEPDLESALARLATPRLTPDQETRANRLRERLGGVIEIEDQSWRDNFACATDPDAELRTWEGIAENYDAYCTAHPTLTDAGRREVFQALLMDTLVPEKHVSQYVRLKALSKDEAAAVVTAGGTGSAEAE